MIVGVPKEIFPGERRVALVPASLPALAKAGFEVRIEAGAGDAAGYPDTAYRDKGAGVVAGRAQLISGADIVLCVRGPGANRATGDADLALFRQGQVVIGFFDPLSSPAVAGPLAERGVTAFAMDLIPRITRAQSMDALSSMATIAGYKAVLLAANMLPRMFPMLMTAAGTVTPARVLVIGAGVAGLQAIATARQLGAVVHGYDIRAAAREQIHSLGAKSVELPVDTTAAEGAGGYARAQDESYYQRQRETLTPVIAESDVVITTAAVPGKRAPLLVSAEAVRAMSPGSVIVDLAADRGGNCELTKPGEIVREHGVTILGPPNLPSELPYHASLMYSKNVSALLLHLVKKGELVLDFEDEITREAILTHGGKVANARVRELLAS
jgi:NAD(P) transhydrogenase subunit alpha